MLTDMNQACLIINECNPGTETQEHNMQFKQKGCNMLSYFLLWLPVDNMHVVGD
jgi:hypothetical protein